MEGLLVFVDLAITLVRVIYYSVLSLGKTICPFLVPMKDISGQTVLVTGAAQGIGALMAKQIAALGAKVVLWDVQKEANEATAEEIRAKGGSAIAFTVDLSNSEAIEDAAQKVVKEVGQVDILLNNAGIVIGKLLEQLSAKGIEKVMAVNATAVMTTTRCFLPGMVARDKGHVVTIASAAGLFGGRRLVDYCASKFAAYGFMESLGLELHGAGLDHIKTTVVCPYFIATGMFAGAGGRFPWLIRTLEPEDVADAVVTAMLRDQDFVLMPRILWIFYLLHNILPSKVNYVLADFLGITNFMGEFNPTHRAKLD